MHHRGWTMKETKDFPRFILFQQNFDAKSCILLLIYQFFQSFKELVATCLVKDPKKRPTAEKLLKHPFFKHARSTDYLDRAVLHGLFPLEERFRMLKVSCSFHSLFSVHLLQHKLLSDNSFEFLNFSKTKLSFQAKEADMLVQNKASYEDKEQLSQVGSQPLKR